jgi:hypothetical protein
MKTVVLALPLLLAAAAAASADEICVPLRMSLDDETRTVREPQDVEQDKQHPDDSNDLTPMEFFYRHSELEAGVMYTVFANALDLKSHMAFYLRYGVEILPAVSVHITYRYNEFGNGPTTTTEDVRLQALFFGAGVHIPLSKEFAFIAGGGIGPMWWDSNVVRNEIGFGITGEAALTARLWEALRLKAGIVLDGCATDFHQNTTTFSVSLSYLVGVELGM